MTKAAGRAPRYAPPRNQNINEADLNGDIPDEKYAREQDNQQQSRPALIKYPDDRKFRR